MLFRGIFINDPDVQTKYLLWFAQIKYSKIPCAKHFNEPPKAEIVCTNGLHDFLSFISIAQKESFHILFVQLIY